MNAGMSKVVALMSMSLDGYVADRDDGVAEVFAPYFDSSTTLPARQPFLATRRSSRASALRTYGTRYAGRRSHMDGSPMTEHRIFTMKFSSVYPAYVNKATRKQRTQQEVDQIICWLTGYTAAGLQRQLTREVDIRTFFAEAPLMHPNSALITGVVCGVRVENVEDPLMRKIRYLDKLIDELATGKPMEKILRQ
jgi:hypothetical protein